MRSTFSSLAVLAGASAVRGNPGNGWGVGGGQYSSLSSVTLPDGFSSIGSSVTSPVGYGSTGSSATSLSSSTTPASPTLPSVYASSPVGPTTTSSSSVSSSSSTSGSSPWSGSWSSSSSLSSTTTSSTPVISPSSGFSSSYPSSAPSYPVSANSTYPVSGTGSFSRPLPSCTSVYTSACVDVITNIYRSTTIYTSSTNLHTLTTTLPSGQCSGASSSSSPTGPGSTGSSSSPVGPGSSAWSSPAGPNSSEQSPTGPAGPTPTGSEGGNGGATVTNVHTVYTTVCPSVPTTCAVNPTYTPGEVYTTWTETVSPVSSPVSQSYTWGSTWTSWYTSWTTSQVTSTGVVTATWPASSSSSDGAHSSPLGSWPATSGWAWPNATSSAAPYPSASGSAPRPYGSGSVSSAPYPTGSGSVSRPSYSTSSSTSSSAACASPTGYPASCKRCEGQPGTDQFCGLTIDTDYYSEVPITCNTKEYNLEITQQNISPDGVERLAMVVNGQMPGPPIEANWGDWIVVHVKNSLPATDLNGTTIHWHGIRQNGTNEMDGVPSITQCPIAPGDSFTYVWQATSYGSSWYHSHFAVQAYDGVYGPIIINGPSQVEYDDEQFVDLRDWFHETYTSIYERNEDVSTSTLSAPTLDTGLINGLNVWNGSSGQIGSRFEMTVTSGKSYRLRVLNSAMQSAFKFYIDGHSFTVIAADFVPITPYTTDIITLNNGQRYDVIFTADQPSDNYWMRADIQSACSPVVNSLDIKGIVHYADAATGTPTSEAYSYTDSCDDEPLASLVPIIPWSAGGASGSIEETVTIQPNGANPNVFKWYLSGTSFFSQWDDPTLVDIIENGTVPDYSGDLAIREDSEGEWIYVIIDTPIPVPHPIHLHGHDFLVLAQGTGSYSSSVALNLVNPPRRDTATVPSAGGTGGYLVVAFFTNNPGVWLMHCHIGWHNAMGFALQIIEALDDIKVTVHDECQLKDTCASWHSYASKYSLTASDSGI